MISAKIVADSTNDFGNRLTTFVLVFPRIVLAEFNTHRMLSKNSASSRAIPFDKMLKRVQEEPFIPIKWMKEHSGMQGTTYFTEEEALAGNLLENHLLGRDFAVEIAKKQSDAGLTKQIVNRYLEPFMYHTVIVTGSEWENFFALRAHPAAEIHIAKLAELMLEAYNTSESKQLKEGEWHIPFGDNFDEDRIKKIVIDTDERCVHFTKETWDEIIPEYQIKIATARCARVSYLNFEGKDDYNADIKLFNILSTSGHWSPFEHCARAMDIKEYNSWSEKDKIYYNEKEKGWSGNFRGFVQYRKMFQGENKTDDRVLKKIQTI